MKQLFYIAISLLIMAAIITPVNATENFITDPLGDYHLGGNPCTEGIVTIFTNTNVTYSGAGTKLYHFYGYCSGGTRNSAGSEEIVGDAGTITLQKAAGTNYLHYLCDSGATARCYNYFIYNTTPAPTPIINFTATPTTGPAALSVTLSVVNYTETNGTIAWVFGDGQTARVTTESTTHVYQNPGIYSVRMSYFGKYTKFPGEIQINDYINVTESLETKTKWFQTIDGTNGNIVLNSSIQLQDIENSSWTNASGLIDDGSLSITTLLSHHINAYSQALGYSDSDDLNILNDGVPQYIMMWPTFAQNVSAGNVSLYITVKDKTTKANIVGAGVTMSPSKGAVQSTTTNEAGIAYFIVTNNTMALITAQAIGQGYQTATTTINTGTGSGGSASAAATILLGKNTVTPTFVTVTTLPGGGTPTPTVTILPGCEDTVSAEGQAKCRAAQSNQGLSFLSANMMDLIMICVFVTILYLLGIKLGR